MKTFKSNGTSFNLLEENDKKSVVENLANGIDLYVSMNIGCLNIFTPRENPISLTQNSWNIIGTLNQKYAPKEEIHTILYSNIQTTFDTSNIIPAMIDISGNIYVWGFSDMTKVVLAGQIFWMID